MSCCLTDFEGKTKFKAKNSPLVGWLGTLLGQGCMS